jgi:hypothetical protein
MRSYRHRLPKKPGVPKHSVARIPHLIRNDGKAGNFHNACRQHRRVGVNEWPAEWISLSPSGIHSLTCLNPIPGCHRRVYTSQRHDRAIPQHAAEGKYR